jgi:ATP-binding cassette, subfamily B, bacterial
MIGKKFPFYAQHDRMDCAPSCLRMIAQYYGKSYELEYLRQICFLNRNGVSLLNLGTGAEELGFKTLMVQLPYEKLVKECPLPCILHWNQDHYVVLYDKTAKGISFIRGLSLKSEYVFSIADPAHGLVKVDEDTLLKNWLDPQNEEGIALLLYPTDEFSDKREISSKDRSFSFLKKYLLPYKKSIGHIIMGMLLGSVFALLFPLLTQILVDQGVGNSDPNLVLLILIAQLFIFFGQTTIEVLRNWILLHMNSRISISIISDFLVKLMRLPISFFDIKSKGDITQRINDHNRIERFLTGSILNALFSFVTVIMFTVVLCLYSVKVFVIFIVLSTVSIFWILHFLKRRKNLDYKRFQGMSDNKNTLYEIIEGMQEIKLNNSEISRRWSWEKIQIRLYKLNIKGLTLDQYQRIGFEFINQLKNIFIIYTTATETIHGTMSIGMMLSVSYIIGQTNVPFRLIIDFFNSAQDAKLSLDRLQEVHNNKDEEKFGSKSGDGATTRDFIGGDIRLDNVSFRYGGPRDPYVLRDVDLLIPDGKVTAIVGVSGSGKTTLLKLLLKFYKPNVGIITVGEGEMEDLPASRWRNQCGVVMQNGYIFSDTILNNIVLNTGEVDAHSLEMAMRIANIEEFVKSKPMGLATKIGAAGNGLSTGQQQRILIARAIYKNPSYLFFDEATSALDANNERVIIQNLKDFYRDRTVVIIAHRLSTVKNADQIVVMENGSIVEVGAHAGLTKLKGEYYKLVKNQLELGM